MTKQRIKKITPLVTTAVSVVFVAYFTRNYFFFQDDFVFLYQAENERHFESYLRQPIFEHFSPVYRILDKLLVEISGPSYLTAHIIELALVVFAILSMYFCLRPLCGQIKSSILSMLFGQSLLITHLTGWWTSSINIMPYVIFTLLSIGCYLRYEIHKQPIWLLPSLFFFFISLLSYETSWLTPAYLSFISAFAFSNSLKLKAIINHIKSVALYWIGLYGATILAILNYLAFYRGSFLTQPPTLNELLKYLYYQFIYWFLPSLLGIRPYVATNIKTNLIYYGPKEFIFLSIALSAVVIILLILYTSGKSTKSWKIWCGFALFYLVNSLIIGLDRVKQFGVGFALNTDFLVTPSILFYVTLTLSKYLKINQIPHNHSDNLALVHRAKKPKFLKTTSIFLVLTAVELGLISSTSLQDSQDFEYHLAASTRSYITTIQNHLKIIKSKGLNYSLLNEAVPSYVESPSLTNDTSLERLFKTLDIKAPFDLLTRYIFLINDKGEFISQSYLKIEQLRAYKSTECLNEGSYVIISQPKNFSYPNLWMAITASNITNTTKPQLKIIAIAHNSVKYRKKVNLNSSEFAQLIKLDPAGIYYYKIIPTKAVLTICLKSVSLLYFVFKG